MFPFPYYQGFTFGTPVIPDIYWNGYSYEERIKFLFKEFSKMITYVNASADVINITHADVEELQEQFEKFVDSGFDDYYAKQVATWIDNHLTYIYDKTMKQVYFGITDDGYFCAYVPDGWKDIQFDTGMVYGRSDYGRLILRYNVEGQGVINNTYSYTLNNPDKAKIIADLETVANQKRVPLHGANSTMFQIDEGYYIQNGYIVTVDCSVTTLSSSTQGDIIIDNLPVGDTEYSSFSCIDGSGIQHSIYVDNNTLCVGDDTISENEYLYINGVYFAKNSNIN